MATKQIKIDSRVKHDNYGMGHVVEISKKTGQCRVDFIRGPMRVCQIISLRKISTAKKINHKFK